MNEDIEENINEGELKEMQEYFDREVWPNMKKSIKDMGKRESCFFAFFAGSEMMKQVNNMQQKNLEEELKKMRKKMKNMGGDEIKKMLEGGVQNE